LKLNDDDDDDEKMFRIRQLYSFDLPISNGFRKTFKICSGNGFLTNPESI